MSTTETPEITDKGQKKFTGPIKPGEVRNPGGRPRGARSKFGEDFVRAFAEHWQKRGQKTLDKLADEHPEAYARVACAILPKVIEFDEDTREVLEKVAAAAVLPFDAIRHKAKEEIESRQTH